VWPPSDNAVYQALYGNDCLVPIIFFAPITTRTSKRLRIEMMRAKSTAFGELPWPTAQYTILTRSGGFSLRLGLAAFLAAKTT